jgi:ABC-type lipoprotein release transport system permease subunit
MATGLVALITASLPLYGRSPRTLLQERVPTTSSGSSARLAMFSVSVRYSLRSLARERGLTLAAIAAMAGAVAVAISYGVAMTSTFRTVDESFRHDRWDYAVDFQYSLYRDEADALVRDSGARQAEPYYRTLVDIRSQDAHALAQLVGLTPGDNLRRQQPIQGRPLAGADEAVISYDLARDLGLQLGSPLALGKGTQTRTVRIVGITNDIFLRTVTVALSDAQFLAQAEDKVTGYYLVGAADARLALLTREETARVTDKRQLVEHFRREVREMMGIVYITIIFSVAVCIVFVTTLVYLGIAEKRGEYAILLSLGFGARRVRRIILAGVAVQILGALVVATPMAWLIAVGLNARMGEAWFAVNTYWELSNFVWPMFATVLIGPVVGFLGVRAVLQLNMPDYLRGRAI